MSCLETAIALAASAHKYQLDKGGAPYILHPIRVMLSVNGEDAMVVAVLHDAIEGGGLSMHRLICHGFSGEVISAVDAMTKRKEESRSEYISRLSSNRLAVEVKIADLNDNMNLSRIAEPTTHDLNRCARYAVELEFLKRQQK